VIEESREDVFVARDCGLGQVTRVAIIEVRVDSGRDRYNLLNLARLSFHLLNGPIGESPIPCLDRLANGPSVSGSIAPDRTRAFGGLGVFSRMLTTTRMTAVEGKRHAIDYCTFPVQIQYEAFSLEK
jgi:hypothetical protein